MKFKRLVAVILALLMMGSSVAYATTEPTEEGNSEDVKQVVTESTEEGSSEDVKQVVTESTEEGSSEDVKQVVTESTEEGNSEDVKQVVTEPTEEGNSEDVKQVVTEPTEEAKSEAGTKAETKVEETSATEEIPANTGLGTELGMPSGSTVDELKTVESPDIIITELPSGQNDSNNEESAAVESVSTSSTGTSAEIKSFSFELVDNQNYKDDEVNCSIRFKFTDTNTGTNYECFITALQIRAQGEKTAKERAEDVIKKITTDSTTQQYLTSKMENIANNFLNGTGYVLTADNQIIDDLIDAEKYDNSYDVEKWSNWESFEKAPYGDIELCWAASTSDVLTYTGWNINGNEDDAFSQFINAFYDNGSWSIYGIRWYLNGVNLAESNIDEDGDIERQSTSYYEKESAKERETYPEKVTISGTPYSVDNIVKAYVTDDGNGIDILADNLIATMDKGDGVGLNYSHELDGIRKGGHAVTVFGYIRELLETGIDALKALFISDSDSDCPSIYTPENTPVPPEIKASTTIDARKARTNEYTMYYTERMISGTGNNTVRIYKSDEDKAEQDNWETDQETGKIVQLKEVITDIVTLKSTKNTNGIPSEEEEKTHDSRTMPDIVPAGINLSSDEVTTGENISVEVSFANQSYKAALGNNSDLVIKYSLIVYDENENFLYRTQYDGIMESLRAMGTATFSTNLPIDTEGIYCMGFQVDAIGYYDADDVWIPIEEAYITNNEWKDAKVRVTVKDPCASVIIPYEIPTYCANYLQSSGDPLTISFKLDSKLGKIVRLLDSKGNEVAEGLYSITDNGDGNYTIIFSAEYLKKLSVGQHRLTLQTENGKIYFIITIL